MIWQLLQSNYQLVRLGDRTKKQITAQPSIFSVLFQDMQWRFLF